MPRPHDIRRSAPTRPGRLRVRSAAGVAVAGLALVATMSGCVTTSAQPSASAAASASSTPSESSDPLSADIGGVTYSTIDDTTMASLAADADSLKGQSVILYGVVVQVSDDGCHFFAQVGNAQATQADQYASLAVVYSAAGDAGQTCTDVAGVAEDDHLRIYGRVNGANEFTDNSGTKVSAIDMTTPEIDQLDPLG